MKPRRLTHEQIKKLTYGISSLNPTQREAVRKVLNDLAHSSDGLVSPKELHLALSALRKTYVISEIDRQRVEAAVFEE